VEATRPGPCGLLCTSTLTDRKLWIVHCSGYEMKLHSALRALRILSATLLAGAWLGCSGEDGAPRIPTEYVPIQVATPSGCSKPEEGCACAKPGEETECVAVRRAGDYVTCGPGVVTCQADGKYGPCVGAGVWQPLDAGAETD